jgi:hypothetical protein
VSGLLWHVVLGAIFILVQALTMMLPLVIGQSGGPVIWKGMFPRMVSIGTHIGAVRGAAGNYATPIGPQYDNDYRPFIQAFYLDLKTIPNGPVPGVEILILPKVTSVNLAEDEEDLLQVETSGAETDVSSNF